MLYQTCLVSRRRYNDATALRRRRLMLPIVPRLTLTKALQSMVFISPQYAL
jgi:hypothetical protein